MRTLWCSFVVWYRTRLPDTVFSKLLLPYIFLIILREYILDP